MSGDKLKSYLPKSLVAIAEKCAAVALAAAGIGAAHQAVAAPTTEPAAASAIVGHTEQQPAIGEGAILLNIVRTDPVTGEQVADHYSHASHASHSSHSSHYSSS